MSKKAKIPTKKTAAANPLLGKLFQKSGVIPPQAPSSAEKQAQTAQQAYLAAYQTWQQQGAAAALPLAEQALALSPEAADILNLTAVLLAQNGRSQEALAAWERIPDAQKTATVYSNIGQAYQDANQLDTAEHNVLKALAIQPDHQNSLWNLAIIRQRQDKIDEAVALYRQLLALNPDLLKALRNVAALEFNRKHYQEAAAYYDHILTLEPGDGESWANNAWSKRRLEQYPAAAAAYRKALEAAPDNADLWFGLGKCLHFTLDFAGACAAIERGLAFDPDNLDAQVSLVLNRQYVIGQAEQTAQDSFRLGQTYCRLAKENGRQQPAPKAVPKKRLHIGVVSSDLRRHPVGLFSKGVFLAEEARQYDWTAYANSNVFDEVSEVLRPTFRQWHLIKDWTDTQVTEQIRADGIDILIDLNGYTAGHRMDVFALQPAPVQITWLGYFFTSGLPTMQAILADPYCVPAHEEHLYSEKVYRLPHTRLCMTPTEVDAPVNTLPALERGHLTFGCFQNLTKINDTVLQLWAAIARKIPTAHWHFQNLRLGADSEDLPVFRQKLEQFGFPMQQVHCCVATHYSDYFPTYNHIDLILDTFPFPGGTTTVDALWMGVPTLTLTMEGMLARQGEQLLSAAGLPDWVCTRVEDYLSKAFTWGDPANWPKLNELRQNLRTQVLASPVYDTDRFARDWFETVGHIWQDACAASDEA